MKRAQPWPMPRDLLLQVRNQFVDDRVAIRADVGGVDCITVVVERIGVLDFDDDRAREIRSGPLAMELIGVFLLGAVVAFPVEASGEVRGEIRIRLCFAPVADVGGEVPVVDEQRIAGVRMRVPAFRQQHVRAEVHRPSPEA